MQTNVQSLFAEPADRAASSYDASIPETYRAMSPAAVVALVLGCCSLLALLDYWLAVLPAVGLIWGIVALRQIRSRREELAGIGLAWTGLLLSAVLLPVGPAWAYYSDISQIPPGYKWISYTDLQPNPKVAGEVVPPAALAMGKNKEKVYIKGYVYSGSQTTGIRQFVLVRDAGTCCFGGNPKVTDRIVVSLANSSGIIYTKDPASVAGTFSVTPSREPGGIGEVYYHLDNAMLVRH